jgi:hypothetical protein
MPQGDSNLSRPEAQRILREAAHDGRVGFEEAHCRRRMVERGVTEEDVLKCLRLGRITEGPALNPRGNWKMTVHRFAAGEELDVVAVIEVPDDGVIVVTVI